MAPVLPRLSPARLVILSAAKDLACALWLPKDVAADKGGNVVYGGGFQTEGIFGRLKLSARSEGKRGQDIFVAKFRPPAATAQ